MGGMFSPRSSTSTTTVVNMPPYAELFAHHYLGRAMIVAGGNESDVEELSQVPELINSDVIKNTNTPYGGKTFASLHSWEASAHTFLATRGTDSDILCTRAKQYISDVFDRLYFDWVKYEDAKTQMDTSLANAYTDDADNISERMAINPFNSAINPSPINYALNMTNYLRYADRVKTEFDWQIEDDERDYRQTVINSVISIIRMDYHDIETRRRAGLYDREYDQALKEDIYKHWYDNYMRSLRGHDILGNAIRSLVGTHNVSTQPFYRPAPIIGIAGGAMTGAVAGSMIGATYGSIGGPAGAAGGAVIGGVLGLLS